MNRIFDSFIWAFALLFTVPVVCIILTWNSVPGALGYSVKLGLEHVAVFILRPSQTASAEMEVRITERRFAESKQLLVTKQSVLGLPYLVSQAQKTSQAIRNISDIAKRKRIAGEYVIALLDVSGELEQQKRLIIAAGPQSTVSIKQTVMSQTVTQSPTVRPEPPQSVTFAGLKPDSQDFAQHESTSSQNVSPGIVQDSSGVTTTGQVSRTAITTALQIAEAQREISDIMKDVQAAGNSTKAKIDNPASAGTIPSVTPSESPVPTAVPTDSDDNQPTLSPTLPSQSNRAHTPTPTSQAPKSPMRFGTMTGTDPLTVTSSAQFPVPTTGELKSDTTNKD